MKELNWGSELNKFARVYIVHKWGAGIETISLWLIEKEKVHSIVLSF